MSQTLRTDERAKTVHTIYSATLYSDTQWLLLVLLLLWFLFFAELEKDAEKKLNILRIRLETLNAKSKKPREA